MRRAIGIVVALLCTLSAVLAQKTGEGKLSSLRGIYETRLAKIQENHEARKAAWPREYVTVLRALQKARQTAGDLDGWTVVNTELKRFSEDRGLTADDIVTTPVELAELQKRQVAAVSALRSDYSKEVLSLTEKYTSHLLDMQKELTRAGKMEEALAAREESQRAKSLPVVTAAEFEAALHSAEHPVKSPVTPRVTEPPKTAEKGWQPKAPIKAGGGSMLYGPGLKTPTVSGAVFRHQSLSTTTHSPMGSKVSARLWVASQNAPNDSYSGPGKRYYTRSRFVATGGATLKNVKAVMQVYVKHHKRKYSYGSSGKIVPTVGSVFRADIPVLDREHVHFDSPRLPQRSRYGSLESSWYGKEFYGVVLSVLSSEGELLYQGASASGLKDIAKARP